MKHKRPMTATTNRFVFLIVGLFFCLVATRNASGETRHFPAEFEPQSAVWLGWPQYDYVSGYSADEVELDIVETLVQHVTVNIVVIDARHQQHILDLIQHRGIPTDNVCFFRTPYIMRWLRDFGPIFLTDGKGNLSVADFAYKIYGYYDAINIPKRQLDLQVWVDGTVDARLARQLCLPIVRTSLISEGGNREVNGKGTLIAVRAVEEQRNPALTLAQIEMELKRMLGLTKVIWLEQGAVEDEQAFRGVLPGPNGEDAYATGTGGHIDEICRFVGPRTVMLAEVSEEEAAENPIAAENRRRLGRNLEILDQASDQEGAPLQIVRMPVPDIQYVRTYPGDVTYENLRTLDYEDGTVFPDGQPVWLIAASSFLNFFVTRDLVVAARYYQPGMPERVLEKDEEAQAILEQLFPDRSVVTIAPLAINLGGGGIHCNTQQQPQVNLLRSLKGGTGTSPIGAE